MPFRFQGVLERIGANVAAGSGYPELGIHGELSTATKVVALINEKLEIVLVARDFPKIETRNL